MLRGCLRLLSLAIILLLSGFPIHAQTLAADQEPGDEHWAGDLSISGFDGPVTSLVNDGKGNVYAGGSFTAIGDKIVNHIARWDGSTWSGLGDGLKESAHNLAVDSQGNLYTDVLFLHEGGLPETLVMRWDGSAWSALGGDLSGLVDTLAEGRDSNILIMDLVVDSHDQLYAGGFFYLINIERYVGYVARWDGSGWTLLGRGMNHTVYQLAVDGKDNLYAGGEFTTAGGVPARRIAKWDGKSWSALGSGLDGEAPTIADMKADKNGNLYVAGQFESAGGIPAHSIAMWDGASWKDLAPGKNTGSLEGDVLTIDSLSISPSGDLYAGGLFGAINGVEANNIASWNQSGWSALSTKTGNGVNNQVFAITVDENDQVFAGGYFTSAGGMPANFIARWDNSAWRSWNEGNGAGMNAIVDALAVDHNGVLYAGGYFSYAGKTPANRVARWDGTEWSALDKGFNAPLHALALDSQGGLYAGGEFTNTGETAVNYIARWDGTGWNPLGGGVSSENTSPQVRALAIDSQGNLYVGGDFTSAGGVAAKYIARWDGSAWSTLGSGMDDQVTDLAVDTRGNLYAAGWFKRAGDVEVNGIARWDGSSWSALGSEANQVEAIAIDQKGMVYASGMFTFPPGSNTLHYIARWDGSSWSPVGSGADNFVHALAVDQEGNLFAGGDFLNAGGAPARRIARWNSSAWSPLGNGIGDEGGYTSIISVLAVDDLGNLYVGGQFTLAGNKPSAYLAKWCAGLDSGGCTFSFEIQASTPTPAPLLATPVLTEPVPLPGKTPTISAPEPGPLPSLSATSEPADIATGGGMDGRYWLGAGIVLTFLLGGLLFFFTRRS